MKNLKINNIAYFLGMALIFTLPSCSKKISYPAPASITTGQASKLSKKKQIAYNFVTAPEDEAVLLESLLSDNFISREQKWKGDKDTFIDKRNSDSSIHQMRPIRIIQDDSLVAVHSRALGETLKFRWDILRIEDEKIQEQWSNMNDSLGLNPAKHSESDGPTIANQIEKTDTNRALIERFIDQCMIREDGGAASFFNLGKYIQHNRDVGDGVIGLLVGMYKMKKQGKIIKFKNNYHVIAEGNLVLSGTEGYVGEQKAVFYDLFRIEESNFISAI